MIIMKCKTAWLCLAALLILSSAVLTACTDRESNESTDPAESVSQETSENTPQSDYEVVPIRNVESIVIEIEELVLTPQEAERCFEGDGFEIYGVIGEEAGQLYVYGDSARENSEGTYIVGTADLNNDNGKIQILAELPGNYMNAHLIELIDGNLYLDNGSLIKVTPQGHISDLLPEAMKMYFHTFQAVGHRIYFLYCDVSDGRTVNVLAIFDTVTERITELRRFPFVREADGTFTGEGILFAGSFDDSGFYYILSEEDHGLDWNRNGCEVYWQSFDEPESVKVYSSPKPAEQYDELYGDKDFIVKLKYSGSGPLTYPVFIDFLEEGIAYEVNLPAYRAGYLNCKKINGTEYLVLASNELYRIDREKRTIKRYRFVVTEEEAGTALFENYVPELRMENGRLYASGYGKVWALKENCFE